MKALVCSVMAAILVVVTGCQKDPLDITPDGRLTLADVFADKNLTAEYLNTCYEYLQWYGTNYNFWTMLAGFSDEAHDNDSPSDAGRPAHRWYSGELTSNWNPLDPATQNTGESINNRDYYGKNWAGIRKVNIFLTNIDNANVPNAAEKARMKAEAKTLRAFYYLEMIKMYGGMPVVETPFSNDYKYDSLKRDSFENCTRLIVRDCDEAIAEANFPYRITTEPERGRFSKAIALHIKSQALLFNASPLWNPDNDQEKWTRAATGTKEALDKLTGNGYALFPDYESYFYGRSDLSPNPADKETIFEIKGHRSHAFSMLMFRMHAIPRLGGDKAGCSPSQELVDSYDMANGEPAITGYSDADHLQPIINPESGYDDANPYKDRDPRFYATVWYNNAYLGIVNGKEFRIESFLGGGDGISNLMQRTKNGYYLRKFRDPKVLDANSGSALFKKYRLGELYLNFAESANEAYGPTADVHKAINTVRKRAGMPELPEDLTKEQMRERIRRERTVELAYEEHRFWDVRRWKILSQTDKFTSGMEWTKKEDGSFTNRRFVVFRRKSWEDKYLILPIPLNEMNRLPGFRQNPGW